MRRPVNDKKSQKTLFCYAYKSDFDQAYCFYCARYENITMDQFLDLGINEFAIKFCSIPETEPIYDILKSRTINLASIKDKEERKFWTKKKNLNKIPQIYLPNEELDKNLRKEIGKNGIK